jgi:hypothetical protein
MNRSSMWAGRLFAELGTIDDILTAGVTQRARLLYAELSREHGGKPDDSVRLPWNALCLAVDQQDSEEAAAAGTDLLAALEAEFDVHPAPAVVTEGAIPDGAAASDAVSVLRE